MTHQKDDMDTASKPDAAPAEKIAPVQGWPAGIPWSLHLEAYAAYSKKWAPQPALIDLEGRNCRGGFSTGELDDFIPGWRDRVSEIGALKAEVARLNAALAASSAAPAGGAVEALRELPELPVATWIACDTEGADFDVTFVTTERDALDVIDPGADDPQALFTRLYTAEQMQAYARAALAAAPVVPPHSLGAPASPSGSTLQPPAAASAAIPGALTVTNEMVTRFLGWPLPKTFAPDCGITFDGRKADAMGYERQWPIGTNLLTAVEARAMLEHVLGGGK